MLVYCDAGYGELSPPGGILVLDEKLDCFGQLKNLLLGKNGLAFYPGPVLPPKTDGSSLELKVERAKNLPSPSFHR